MLSDQLMMTVMNDRHAYQSFKTGMGILRCIVSRAAAQTAHYYECDEHTGKTTLEHFPQNVRDEAIVDLVRYFLGEISEEKSNEERERRAASRSGGAEPGLEESPSRGSDQIPHGSEGQLQEADQPNSFG